MRRGEGEKERVGEEGGVEERVGRRVRYGEGEVERVRWRG